MSRVSGREVGRMLPAKGRIFWWTRFGKAKGTEDAGLDPERRLGAEPVPDVPLGCYCCSADPILYPAP